MRILPADIATPKQEDCSEWDCNAPRVIAIDVGSYRIGLCAAHTSELRSRLAKRR